MKKLSAVAIGLLLAGCVSVETELADINKPSYQQIDEEERQRRIKSCREDPYQQMCALPGP